MLKLFKYLKKKVVLVLNSTPNIIWPCAGTKNKINKKITQGKTNIRSALNEPGTGLAALLGTFSLSLLNNSLRWALLLQLWELTFSKAHSWWLADLEFRSVRTPSLLLATWAHCLFFPCGRMEKDLFRLTWDFIKPFMPKDEYTEHSKATFQFLWGRSADSHSRADRTKPWLKKVDLLPSSQMD